MVFYDAHLHCRGGEAGGFIVGLEGKPWFEGINHNVDAMAIAKRNCQYKFFRYITKDEVKEPWRNGECDFRFLKYHPRREGYTPDEVISSITMLSPRAVMIDTLNEPSWIPYDYWKIARAFPDIKFIFPHAGGYLVNDFVKICHFQMNVWIDFALTHTNFGSISSNPLPYVDEAISYSLKAPFKSRVLMGSDLPFFNQKQVVHYYEGLGELGMLNDNFCKLFEELV